MERNKLAEEALGFMFRLEGYYEEEQKNVQVYEGFSWLC